MEIVAAIGLIIASYIITALITPKQKVTPPATLAEFNVPTVDEGTPQEVVFGDVWMSNFTVLWYGDLQSKSIHGKGKK